MKKVVFVVFLAGFLMNIPFTSVSYSANELETIGGLIVDEVSSQAIIKATTKDEYLTPWVSIIPDHPDVPSPRDILGHIAGAPGELTQVDQISHYFQILAEASDRVQFFRLGLSHEGREMIAVAIADEQTIASLEEYRGYLNALADPRKLEAKQAADIVSKAKPIYWITAGLHSTELGPPETAMELAYRLAVEERPVFQSIRKNVITLITPVLEVDGRARQVDWYYRHLKGNTDYYDKPRASPPFWGRYTFHDNNRDAIVLSQPLTKNYMRAFFDWTPTLSLDLHESVPLLYVSTGTGPYGLAASPITVSEWQALANYEVSRLTAMGLPGVWTWGFYTGWYPGYLLWVANNHNSIGRFFETFGNGSAETMRRDLTDYKYAGDKVTSKQWYRPNPPEREIEWSMRNNVNYMLSGVIASLEFVSRNGSNLVENYYRKGLEAVSMGRDKPPHAILIPQDQRDKDSGRNLLNLLMAQGIEVSVVEKSAKLGELKIAKGDALIRLDQPYGPLAKTLLEIQEFPADAKVPPYDDIAWSLGLTRGVNVTKIEDSGVFQVPVRLATRGSDVFPILRLPRMAKFWAIPHRAQAILGPLRFALADAQVFTSREIIEVGRKKFPAGTLFVDTKSVDSGKLEAALQGVSVEVVPVDRLSTGNLIDVDLPRVAVLHSWLSTQNAGWLRYELDRSKIPYELISKERLQQENLRDSFDVLVIPAFGPRTTLAQIVGGLDPKWSPLAYTPTEQFPSHGRILSSDDITGGIGFEGLSAIKDFVMTGGTLVALASGSVVPVESGMVHGISISRPAGLNVPGSVLRMKILNRSSPLAFGYDQLTHVFRTNNPLFSVSKDRRALVVAQFGTKKVELRPWDESLKTQVAETMEKPKTDLVLSGAVLKGKQLLDGAPALLTKAVGGGRIVLFGWNPMHRSLNHHDHAFFYNALLFWNDLD